MRGNGSPGGRTDTSFELAEEREHPFGRSSTLSESGGLSAYKHSSSLDRGLRERSREKYDSENMHEALNWTGPRKPTYESNTASTGRLRTTLDFRMSGSGREREDYLPRQTPGLKYGVKSSKIDLSSEYSLQRRNSDWMRG